MGENNTCSGHVRVCFVTAGGQAPAIIANALGEAFGPIDVIIEDPEPQRLFIARRARKVGRLHMAGQYLTMNLIIQMKRLAKRAVGRIPVEDDPAVELASSHRVHRLTSVNEPDFLAAVERLGPDIVFLCGCRIVKPDVLSRIRVPVINYHAGITPRYRGMNGGYWALAEDDAENFGSTVHHVDTGVDTGPVIAQVRGKPRRGDTIWTYPLRQAAMSRAMCVEGVRGALRGDAFDGPLPGPSVQRFHPEIWRYLWTGITRNIW